MPWIALIYRLIVGLAKVSDPRTWEDESTGALVQLESGVVVPQGGKRRRTVSMRAAWEAGRGLGLVAFGMWLMLLALLRPPPWLARPPLLAISLCFAGSIAAKPRLEPPLFDPAMPSSFLL